MSRAALIVAFRRIAPVVFLGVVPIASLAIAFASYSSTYSVAYDFHHEVYPEAKLILQGQNPYPPSDSDLSDGTNNIWPVAAAILVAPLTLLPAAAADWVMTFLVLASLGAALWLVGVRDWRVYGVTLLWPPVISGYQTANATLPLCLLCALAWRTRSRAWLPGIVVGVALAVKFFLWPLSIWLAAIGRIRASVASIVLAAASLLAIAPFTPIPDYVDLIRNLAETFEGESYTVYALLTEVGAPSPAAHAANYAVGALLLALAWRRASLALAVGAALVLSPIVWLHFFALLTVPLAIAWPRFDWRWLLAFPLWVVPGSGNGAAWQIALALGVLVAILVACERSPLVPVAGIRLEPVAR